MLNKRIFYLLIFVVLLGCGNKSVTLNPEEKIKYYHLVFLQDAGDTGRGKTFEKDLIRYVGKLTINTKTNDISCDCLHSEDEENILSSIKYYQKNPDYKIHYQMYSEKKPKKIRKDDSLYYINHAKLWYLSTQTSYKDSDFWKALERKGIFKRLSGGEVGLYRPMSFEIGEKYFKAKKEGLGDIALRESVFLNDDEHFSK